MSDIDERTRLAYRPVEMPAADRDRTWAVVKPRLQRAALRRSRSSAWVRPLIAIAILVVSLSSMAYAAEPHAVKRLIGIDPTRPADRMHVFQQASSTGTNGLSAPGHMLLDRPDGPL
jgi:hypothetical protein